MVFGCPLEQRGSSLACALEFVDTTGRFRVLRLGMALRGEGLFLVL